MPTPRPPTARLTHALLIVFLGLAGLLGVTDVAQAASLLVDRADDASGLACTGAADDCTLRSAVEIANANGTTADQITFAQSMTINLTRALQLTADNTTVSGQIGQSILINGATISLPMPSDYGNVFRITGSGVRLERLRIYGSPAGWSNIWITGTAQRVTIAYNTIGDDNSDIGGCGQSPSSFSGLYINSTGTIADEEARVWIYGNVIECNQGTAGDALNPGDGIYIVDTNRVVIGANESGTSAGNETNFIETNRRNGVTITGSSANNELYGSFIQNNGNSGVLIDDAQATRLSNNVLQNNANSGLELLNGARGTRVGVPFGGATPDDTTTYGNSISGNGREGIYVSGNTTQTNFIFGNRIGPDNNGNGRNGIMITNGAKSTFVGVSLTERNLISGNRYSGVLIDGAASGNLVQGNYIGTGVGGTGAIPNGTDGSGAAQRAGVTITGGATNNTVGGSTVSNRNVISGNTGSGVYIGGAGTSGNLIDGNYIGLNAAGTSAIPNGDAGIAIIGAGVNTLGHDDQDNPQLIGGNRGEGILVQNTNGTQIRSSNFVGYGGGIQVPGNGRDGILLSNASTTRVAPYAVIGNGGPGIAVAGASSLGNTISFTESRGNKGLAIDLGRDDLTPNDPGDADSGPNALLNYPVITGVSGSTVSGTACPSCAVYIYRADGSVGYGYGGGGLLGGDVASATGNWSITIPSGYTRLQLTAIAIDGSNNTSEMTPRPQIYIPLSQK